MNVRVFGERMKGIVSMGLVAVQKNNENEESVLDKLLTRDKPIAICFTDSIGNIIAFQLDAEAFDKNELPTTKKLFSK